MDCTKLPSVGESIMTARGRVLVVDDDHVVLKITRARLESAGFAVVTRSEALGTLQSVLKEKPDVVLLDLQMPALDGEAIANLVSKRFGGRRVSIIFHSSECLLTLQAKAQRTGALGAIPKTEDDQSFIAQFERLFARAKRNGAQ
jgi:CheY-like chemotaxis protein